MFAVSSCSYCCQRNFPRGTRMLHCVVFIVLYTQSSKSVISNTTTRTSWNNSCGKLAAFFFLSPDFIHCIVDLNQKSMRNIPSNNENVQATDTTLHNYNSLPLPAGQRLSQVSRFVQMNGKLSSRRGRLLLL